jgi:hypothetical protein
VIGQTFHPAISVDVDRFPDQKLEREYGPIFAQLGATDAAAIRMLCSEARAQGRDVFPPCDNTKPNGHCAGHQVAPQRIQLSRKAGFRLQEVSLALNGLPAVNVARPGRWGNPYVVGPWTSGLFVLVDQRNRVVHATCAERETLIKEAVKLFRDELVDSAGRVAEVRETLRGRNLGCWCQPGSACHADVLLDLAAEAAAPITEPERHVLEHATGWLSESPLYRNRFTAGARHADMPAIESLCARGLMLLAASSDTGDSLYCVTIEGIRALRALPGQPKRTKKAAKELDALIAANMTETR